jgi:hypothetical protein
MRVRLLFAGCRHRRAIPHISAPPSSISHREKEKLEK